MSDGVVYTLDERGFVAPVSVRATASALTSTGAGLGPGPGSSISRTATATAAAARAPIILHSSDGSDDDDEEEMIHPWEREGWIPRTKSGKQITPNTIRSQLQKYIDECKANKTATQTSIIETMHVNNNSFRRFMNPKTYKNQWSACDNGTYWAAAKLLERVKYEKAEAKKAERKAAADARKREKEKGKKGKRKADSALEEEELQASSSSAASAAAKKVKVAPAATKPKSRSEKKVEALILVNKIMAVELENHDDGHGDEDTIRVYDSCPQVVAKIKKFLEVNDGVTKSMLLDAWGGVNGNSLSRFLAGKKQDQCANCVYRLAYMFFEKQRIMEGKKKSAARIRNEDEHPRGFSLRKESGYMWVFTGR